MKNLALCFALTLLAILPCPAQTGPGGSNYPISGIYVLSAPSGACTGNTVEYVVVVGTEYSCQNGTWGQIGGGGGGGGTFAGLTPGINTSTTPFGIAPGSAVGGSTSNLSVNCPASDTNTAPCLLVGTGASSTQPVETLQVQNVDAYKLIEIPGPNQQHIFGSCATAPIQTGSDVARIVHCTQTHSGVVADRYFASYNLFTGTIVQSETAAPAGTGGTLFSGRVAVNPDGSLGTGQELFNVSDGGQGTLGVDNSVAGTLNLANGSAAAHTIFGSAATTTNTILGFATVPVNGHLVTCTVSGTTCTLTDGGAPSGGGTVTVVGAGNLTSTAIVTGGGSQALQTPSATSTLDASGNAAFAGTLNVTGHVTFEGVTSTGATGTGNLVFKTSPTLITPTLGVATATTVNKVTITAPATGSTVTIADGKTLTVSNTMTLVGTDSTTMTFPTTSATVARTDAANIFTGHQTIEGVTSTGATGTGNFVFSAAPTLTGHPTIEGVTSTGATGTGKFVFDTSPTLVTPTLGAASATSLTASGAVSGGTYLTATKCAAAGTAANPSVASCSAAPSGSFSCATNASTGTCTINTTAMTSSSAVLVQPDSSLGTLLSVTCNTTADTGLTAPRVSARSNGTSFTITLGTFATNPLCFNYFIIN